MEEKKYKELTLDWDYYMNNKIQEFNKQIFQIIQISCSEIEILDTQKGLNIIGKLKKELSFNDLMMLRLYCFDDIFRVRNEVSKKYENQEHRINRIWKIKNGKVKQEIFKGKIETFTEPVFFELLKILGNKKEAKKND